MKSHSTLPVWAILVGLALGFWLYGEGRTMRETVNFNTTAFASGLVLGVALPLTILVPLLIAAKQAWPPCSWLFAFVTCLLIGSLASEWLILRDEARFSTEVSKAPPGTPYSRARAWPNQTCSLVFVPGQGTYATD